jgi:DNA polymerase I-like protein with 3'-5' exonuclease and polymerase domains
MTVPSSSEVKGVVVAPDDSLLIYTDISSMELRGIAAVSNDKVMINYFNSGKDIKSKCPYIVIYRKQIA